MSDQWRDIIDRTDGLLTIRANGIDVHLVLGYLAAGSSADEIIDHFPELTGEEISACQDYLVALSQGTD